MRLDPKWASPQNNIGTTYYDQGRDDLAIPAFRKAIEIDPYLTLSRINLARALARQKQVDAAIAEYAKVIEKNPGARDAYKEQAYLFAAKGDYQAALASADDLVRHDLARNSPDADAFANRGYFYAKLGDYVRAIADYSEAIRQHPDYPVVYLDRAFSYLKLGRKVEAAADFRRVIELPGPDEWKQEAQLQLDALDSH